MKASELDGIAEELQRRLARSVPTWRDAERAKPRPGAGERLADKVAAELVAIWRVRFPDRGRTARVPAQMLTQLQAGLRAAVRAADPAAVPELAGDAIRRHGGATR